MDRRRARRDRAGGRPARAGLDEGLEVVAWVRKQLVWEGWIEAARANAAEVAEGKKRGATSPAPEPVPQGARGRARRGRRRWARLAGRIAIGLGVAAALSSNMFVLTQRSVATPVGLTEVLEGFRAGTPRLEPVDSTPERRGAPGPAREARAAAPARAALPRERAVHPRDIRLPVLRPAEGVYAYATRGGERISFADSRHDYPSRTYAAVRLLSGCLWEFEHRILAEHVEHLTFCGGPGRLSLLEETVDITFFGQRERETYVCDPPEVLAAPGRTVGAAVAYTCASDDGRVTGRITLLGRQRVVVGHRPVETVHLLSRGTISGRARGTSRAEIWLHPASGLMVKLARTVRTTSEAFGATIEYTEDARFALESLTPRT